MKKNTSFLLAFVLFAIGANAQKDSYYIGGAVGFSSARSELNSGAVLLASQKTTNWNFSPEFGTFLTDNIQLGLGLTLMGNKQVAATLTTKQNSYGGTLYSRYFFGEGNFRPFVGVNISALPGKQTTTASTADTKTFDFGANLNAGFGYSLSKRVTAVGSFGTLGYSNSTSKTGSNKTTTNTFGLNTSTLGNRFTVGVYYTL